MQDALTDPMTGFLLKIAIGLTVGWVTKNATGSGYRSPYLPLGIAGALVGAKITEALEVYFLGTGPLIGAVVGATFFVVGWRQMQPP